MIRPLLLLATILCVSEAMSPNKGVPDAVQPHVDESPDVSSSMVEVALLLAILALSISNTANLSAGHLTCAETRARTAKHTAPLEMALVYAKACEFTHHNSCFQPASL